MSAEELAVLLHRAGGLLGHGRTTARGQGRILHTLAREGSLSQRQLQQLFAMRSASVSELLLKLERKGLITRQRSDQDRRSFVVSLTEAGAAAAKGCGEGGRNDFFAALSVAEQQELHRLLKKLLDSTDQSRPQRGRGAAHFSQGARSGFGRGKAGHGGGRGRR